MGLSDSYKMGMTNADGRVIVMQAGSPEGFGKRIAEINGRRAILYNDELGKLVSKARIESSSFPYDLLTWYNAGEYGNNVKSVKDSYTFPAGSYCFGWQWCCTDRGFKTQWAKIAGVASGLEDRMFFLVAPEKPRPSAANYYDPILAIGADKTREAIQKAEQQEVYTFLDPTHVNLATKDMGPRQQQMVLKLALYFAVDLNLSEITEDCTERAAALVNYRNDAVRFLDPIEGENQQAILQKTMTRELRRHGGRMSHREFCREMSYSDYGTIVWDSAYQGMLKSGQFKEWWVRMPSGQKSKMIGLLKDEDGY